jgi:hypothetical protein
MENVVIPDLGVGALGYSKRPAFANVYAVAGRFISVESPDPHFTDLFRRYFAGWHVEPILENDNIRPDANILISATDPPPSPAHLKSFEVADGGLCRTDAKTYFFENNGSAVRAGNDRPPLVEVWIGKTPQARERSALARLIFNASMAAMRRCGLFELHAAGMVQAERGAGILVIGPSGSGKSTLATQLAAAGWQYLSDDSLLLYSDASDAEPVKARALRRVFALSDETLSASGMDLESIPTETVPLDPLKTRFEPRSVFPDSFVDVCIPRTLFFSQVTNEPASRTRLLSQRETMAQLIRMCPWSCYDKPSAETHLSLLAELARQAKGYLLFAGRDLFGDPEYAGRFLLSRTE